MAASADPNVPSVLCTLGLRGVLTALADRLAADGLAFRAHYESTNAIVRRIAAGERGDVAILLDGSVEALTRDGVLVAGSRRDLARSGVAIAVRAGAAKPDISTVAALRRTLLAAPSIAYTRSGASGLHFASVIARLGIADVVNRNARIQDGFVGELAARGEVALAVQQASELMPVAGIDIVGPLPNEVQAISVFSAAIFTGSHKLDAARALIARLAADDIAPLLRAKGLEPIAGAQAEP